MSTDVYKARNNLFFHFYPKEDENEYSYAQLTFMIRSALWLLAGRFV